MHNFSLLDEPYSRPPRRLPVALAHELARVKPAQPRMALLSRIFSTLAPAAQLECKYELAEIRAAKRGVILAQIAD